MNVTNNSILLVTLPDQEATYELMVYVNGVKAICEFNCNFTFTTDSTPEVSSISSNYFNDLNNIYNITGSRFSNSSSKVQVRIGTEICKVENANNTEIVCVLSRLNLGLQNVSVYVEGNLNIMLIYFFQK